MANGLREKLKQTCHVMHIPRLRSLANCVAEGMLSP